MQHILCFDALPQHAILDNERGSERSLFNHFSGEGTSVLASSGKNRRQPTEKKLLGYVILIITVLSANIRRRCCTTREQGWPKLASSHACSSSSIRRRRVCYVSPQLSHIGPQPNPPERLNSVPIAVVALLLAGGLPLFVLQPPLVRALRPAR